MERSMGKRGDLRNTLNSKEFKFFFKKHSDGVLNGKL